MSLLLPEDLSASFPLATERQSFNFKTLKSFSGTSDGSGWSQFDRRRKLFSYRHILHFQSNPGMATSGRQTQGGFLVLANLGVSRGCICPP
jgi:hypothetical protein